MTSDEHERAWVHGPDDRLATMGCDELLALDEALDLRVRRGTATLEDFGALARTQRELARRAEVRRRARS